MAEESPRSAASAAAEQVQAIVAAAERSAAALEAAAREDADRIRATAERGSSRAREAAARLAEHADELERRLDELMADITEAVEALRADLAELRGSASGDVDEELIAEVEVIAAKSPEVAASEEPGDASNGPAHPEGARVIALKMALEGSPREETARYLSENFELADADTLLDEVYEKARR